MSNINKASTPFFSVVLPVYNGESYLPCALESVLAQTDSDWELVAVDDFSSDRTPEILADYAAKDSRIRVVRNSQNLNIAPSLNRGIRYAHGTWIVRLDADDFFYPSYLKILRSYTEHPPGPDCFFSSWATVVDESGAKILDIRLPKAETIQRMMTIENFLYHPATSFPKRLWEKVGGYPENDRTIAEDTALWIRFFQIGAKLVMIPQFFLNYRLHYSNLTSINDAKLFDEAGAQTWKTIRQNREWKISLYLKQMKLKMARTEILTLGRMQKGLSFKNLQYFLLTFLPQSFVHFFMWEFRPRARAFFKSVRGPSVRV